MFVTSRSEIDPWTEVREALATLGLDARGEDQLAVDGAPVDLPVLERAHPNPAELAALVGETGPSVVIADRISDAGRDVLRDAGWSWLDRRGHLRLWAPGIRIEAPFEVPDAPPSGSTGNVWTTVGLEVALHALIAPTEEVRARAVARETGRSVGATHELIARFTKLGLVGPSTHRPLLPDLFWEAAAHWPDDGWLTVPVPVEVVAERVGPDGLIRVDERAATLGGARIAAASDLPARCYVESGAVLRKLRGLAGTEGAGRCLVRVSPIRWIPELPDHPPTAEHPWRVAHPMLCALRLAGDPSRGREIVEAWGIVPGGSEQAER